MYSRYERFSFCLSEISKYWHKLTAGEMEKYGLKSAHGVYLLALARHEEGLTAPQLCDICGKDKSDVSRMMRIMEEQGIARKDGGHQNRYGGVYRLTQQGWTVSEALRLRAGKAVEIAGAELTDEQREIFYDVLEMLTESLREISRKGIPE